MDERDAFERQLAAEIDRQVGPPRPVDALAVTREARVAARRWQIRTTLGAIGSLAAGVATLAAVVLLLGQPLARPAPDVPAAPSASLAPAATAAAPTAAARATAAPTAAARATAAPTPITGSRWAVVTGNAFCGDVCEGTPVACDEALSDPRLNGAGSWSWVWTCPSIAERWPFQPGCVVGGHLTITGPDGSWSGPISGFWDATALRVALQATLTGSQGYAGWSFVARYLVTMNGLADVYGVVYQGAPPPSFRG